MKKLDLILLSSVIFLTFFGLFMIYDASSYIAFRDFGDKYHYIKEQSRWTVLGFLGLLGFSIFDYKKLYYLSFPILIAAITLLILVFIPGVGVYILGARRWIDAGFIILQPAEFVKLGLAIYLSAWFSRKEKGKSLPFFLLMGFIMLLIMLEPDMGTASIVLFEALAIYFFSGGSIAALFIAIPVISFIGLILIKLEPYRLKRLTTFLDPTQSVQGASYHVQQILIALGMGGLSGVGFGNSLQKYAYLPENTTDSIFAIIGEEVGFIGSSFIIFIFIVVCWRGFIIASSAKDQFGRLLACGIISFLSIQAIVNLGAQTMLMPLTGVPLPFISYGGSSLVVDLCAIGILINISMQKNV